MQPGDPTYNGPDPTDGLPGTNPNPGYTPYVPRVIEGTNDGSGGGGGTWGGWEWDQPGADWVPAINRNPQDGGDYGFTAPMPRRVAGPSGLEDYAAWQVPGLFDKSWDEELARDWGGDVYAGGNYMQKVRPWEMDLSQEWSSRSAAAGNYLNNNPVYGQWESGDLARSQVDTARDQIDYSGGAIAQDAGLQAAQEAFNLTAVPMLNNQYGAMGLGRSTNLGGAVANAWAANATPHIQAAIQRQVDDKNRIMQAEQFASQQMGNLGQLDLSRKLGAIGAMQGAAGQFGNIAGLDTARRSAGLGFMSDAANRAMAMDQQAWNQQQGAINTAMQVGGVGRGIAQQANDAAYEDFLRRQALAEMALTAPFGQLTDTFGETVRGGGGK